MRLQRIGRKNNPAYRVLIVDSRQGPKSGKFIDQIGSYDPKAGKPQIDVEKAKVWIAKGVQVSGTVHNMLVDLGAVEGKKVNVLPKKSPVVSESPEMEAPKGKEAADDAPAEKEAEEKTEKVEEEVTAAEGDSPEVSGKETSKKEETPAAA